MRNALTIDVEDYFHPSEVQNQSDDSIWDQLPSRVEHTTERVLTILRERNVRATFFVLGWVAERYPRLVRRIVEDDHEIGCHSYSHRLIYEMNALEMWDDTLRAQRAIEGACGVRPVVYRAPSFSITRESFWALDVLRSCGFTHDSSIYPVSHDRYGIPGFERHAREIQTDSGAILEVPVATASLFGGRVAAVGGGGYLRMLPYSYTAAGIRRINRHDNLPACVYLHPWELDEDSPVMNKALISRMRTRYGLRAMEDKFRRLLSDFRFGRLTDVFPVHAENGATRSW